METKRTTFDDMPNRRGIVLYEYVRGSKSHGLYVEGKSDTDIGGVYICDIEDLIDLGNSYHKQIASDSNDLVWYEFTNYLKLLSESNPNVLESLFIDDKHVIYEHPWMTLIKSHRDSFISRKCILKLFKYGESQIRKCRGLNKKMLVNPCTERLEAIDFCYTFKDGGSIPIRKWLDDRGLFQKYCGLVNIPNMKGMYAMYYDYGSHVNDIYFSQYWENVKKGVFDGSDYVKNGNHLKFKRFIEQDMGMDLDRIFKCPVPLEYKGMVNEDGSSNEMRLSSIPKGERPVCYMSFGLEAYSMHCKEYREYQQWIKDRNPERYDLNKDKNYDAKNVSQCFRLVNMALEIIQGNGFIVDRSGIDRDFLLDVKNHKYSYEEVIEMMEEKKRLMEDAYDTCSLPDDVDLSFLNSIALEIREKQINDKFLK